MRVRALALVVLAAILAVSTSAQRECSLVAAYDSTGQPTPVLGHWDEQGTCP